MRALAWLFVGAANPRALSRSAAAVAQKDAPPPPCLALHQHGLAVPRCGKHGRFQPLHKDQAAVRCPAGGVAVDFGARAEAQPGRRLVGSQRGDKYPCYPLSDEDFWRSREAVHVEASKPSWNLYWEDATNIHCAPYSTNQ